MQGKEVKPTDRLKIYRYTSQYGDEMVDITNDAGNPSDEYSLTEDLAINEARRLVACWNACRNISTEDLEKMSFE